MFAQTGPLVLIERLHVVGDFGSRQHAEALDQTEGDTAGHAGQRLVVAERDQRLEQRGDPAIDLRARMYAPLHGIAEDPATGSAAAAAAGLLRFHFVEVKLRVGKQIVVRGHADEHGPGLVAGGAVPGPHLLAAILGEPIRPRALAGPARRPPRRRGAGAQEQRERAGEAQPRSDVARLVHGNLDGPSRAWRGTSR